MQNLGNGLGIRSLGLWPGKVHVPQFPRDSVEPLSIWPLAFAFLPTSGTAGPSRPALVRIRGAGTGHGSEPFLPSGQGGKTMVGNLASKDLTPHFLGSPNTRFGSNRHAASPMHVNCCSHLRRGPCGLSQGCSQAQPREDTERTKSHTQREQKASQVSKWISGTRSGGNIRLKIKLVFDLLWLSRDKS